MSDRTKNPSSILYWNDLENDAELKTCSLGAKGLWSCHMLPMAARSPEPGVVIVGAHPSKLGADLEVVLARAVGAMPDEIAFYLRELVDSGTASVDAGGRLFNRRMVRENHTRQVRAEAGQKGAAARWGTKCEVDGKHPGKGHGKTEGPGPTISDDKQREIPGLSTTAGCDGDGKPMPSSLLNDSKKKILGTDSETPMRADRAPKAERSTRLPDGWRPEGELRQWTIDHITEKQSGVSAGHELEKFRDHWKAAPGAKGRKADWPATWRNWIREAIRREGKGNGPQRPNGAQPTRRTGAQNAAAFASAFRVPRGDGSADDGSGT